MIKDLSEKGAGPLRRDNRTSKIDSPSKGQAPFPIGAKSLSGKGSDPLRIGSKSYWRLMLASLFAISSITTVTSGELIKISVTSSVDQSEQPSYLKLPDNYEADTSVRPLVVALHSWSTDLENRNPRLEALANERGWLVLFPNFRGPNNRPQACGSLLAQQDILDALAWTEQHYRADSRNRFLTGNSGGGHMTMLMSGRYPEVWTAASAWVGISDLAAWYAKHAESNYGAMMRQVSGGHPGESAEIDLEYRSRSPLTFLHQAGKLPIDIAAGIHDGHQGSVPIRHSLEAFNVLAAASGAEPISEAEILQLSQNMGRLENPKASDLVEDPALGRAIYLRRHTPAARVTIFEGGHEGIASAAVAWFEMHIQRD